MAIRWGKSWTAPRDQGTPSRSLEETSVDGLWRISSWAIGVTAVALGSFAALDRVAADNPQSLEISRSGSGGAASFDDGDPQILKILDSGLSERGARTASAVCAGCHGDGKTEPRPGIPNLAGQKAQALYKQLIDFRSGKRLHPQMEAVAKALEIAELANSAAFYSSEPRPRLPGGLRAAPEIERLANVGDKNRDLSACMTCHAGRDTDPVYAPILAGQSEAYLLAQLEAFASGLRKNDAPALMRKFAGKLAPHERVALARYFHGDFPRVGAPTITGSAARRKSPAN